MENQQGGLCFLHRIPTPLYPPISKRMLAIGHPQTPSFNQMHVRKEEAAAECGMGLPSIGAWVEPVPIIHLPVLGEGDCLEPDGGLLPSPAPALQCSLCSVLWVMRVMRPLLREGMGADC